MIELLLVIAYVGILVAIVFALIFRPKMWKYSIRKWKFVFLTLGLIAIWSILLLATNFAYGF